MKNIEYFFKPQSIAIIGASPNVKALNGMLLKYLLRHNYGGQIYPVNPKYQEISGLKCYPRLADIPGPVDMVLVAIAAKNILPTLEQRWELHYMPAYFLKRLLHAMRELTPAAG